MEINIEEIMMEIRKDIKERKLEEEKLRFQEITQNIENGFSKEAVELIMEEVRADIKARNLQEENIKLGNVNIVKTLETTEEGFSKDRFMQQLTILNENWNIPVDMPYYTNNGFYNHIKKIIKKLTRFIVFPLVMAQNEVNASATRLFLEMNAYIEDRDRQIDELTRRVHELENKLEGK